MEEQINGDGTMSLRGRYFRITTKEDSVGRGMYLIKLCA